MTNVVVDTSVIVKWINQTDENDIGKSDKILLDAKNSKINLLAPELAKYEIGNVLLKGKHLTPSEASISLTTVYSLPISFVSETEDIAKETFAQAHKNKITYYDASFLSLAKRYNASLITENTKHQQQSQNIKVVALKDY